MSNLRLWRIENGLPFRSEMSAISLEKNLEEWIEKDTSLIQDGLLIVGRQLRVQNGIIDLLAIDTYGRWHIIEVKREKLDDKTIGQALRYTAWLEKVPAAELKHIIETNFLKKFKRPLDDFLEDHKRGHLSLFQSRDITAWVVGTKKSVFLDQTVNLLNRKGIKTRIITFQAFADENKRMTLVREELDQSEIPPDELDINLDSLLPEMDIPSDLLEEAEMDLPGTGQKISPESLFAVAESQGIGREFRAIFDIATKHGLYPRTYKYSIMYTPPQNKTRVLFCVWTTPPENTAEGVVIDLIPKAFAEFFPISESKVIQNIGKRGKYVMALPRIEAFSQALDKLFAEINNAL